VKKPEITSKLSSSMEDYIETIALLSRMNESVRVKDIADTLGIRMPSVTSALDKLKGKGLILYEKYGIVELTDIGKSEASRVYKKHRILSKFLSDILGVEPSKAESEACLLEHSIGTETSERIEIFMKFHDEERRGSEEWVKRLNRRLTRGNE
jgi:DtxR family Mn-dependent transcriptional regulator